MPINVGLHSEKQRQIKTAPSPALFFFPPKAQWTPSFFIPLPPSCHNQHKGTGSGGCGQYITALCCSFILTLLHSSCMGSPWPQFLQGTCTCSNMGSSTDTWSTSSHPSLTLVLTGLFLTLSPSVLLAPPVELHSGAASRGTPTSAGGSDVPCNGWAGSIWN